MQTNSIIILASSSSRRRKLLEDTGLKFKVVKNNIKEKFDPTLKPNELAKKLSLEKARTVHKKYKKSIIISADTLVSLNGKIYGKPKNAVDAKKILMELSNKTHSVITGFTIINSKTNKVITKSVKTKVTMKNISEKEIENYIKTKEPFGKAGAYALQGTAKKFIKKIDGDLSNVVGLPIGNVLQELKKIENNRKN